MRYFCMFQLNYDQGMTSNLIFDRQYKKKIVGRLQLHYETVNISETHIYYVLQTSHQKHKCKLLYSRKCQVLCSVVHTENVFKCSKLYLIINKYNFKHLKNIFGA